MFEHVAELLVLDPAVRRAIVFDDLLDFGWGELRLFADGQHQRAVELVFGDDAAAQTVVILEELEAADAVLVDGDANLVEDLLEGQVDVRLHGGGDGEMVIVCSDIVIHQHKGPH